MKNILLVVDMQNGFVRYDQTKLIGKKIIQLTKSKTFDYVIATQFINKKNSQYVKWLNWNRLQKSPDIDLIKGLKPNLVIKKNVYTCVNDAFLTKLKKINGNKPVNQIYICGADTDCCVLKIATDLFEHGIKPLVLLDYVNSNGGVESHKAGITALKRIIGSKCLLKGKITSKKDFRKL